MDNSFYILILSHNIRILFQLPKFLKVARDSFMFDQSRSLPIEIGW